MIIGERTVEVITKYEDKRIIRVITKEIIDTNISKQTFEEITDRYDDGDAHDYGVYYLVSGDYNIEVEKFLEEIDDQKKDDLDIDDLDTYSRWERELLPYRDYTIEIKDGGIDSIKEQGDNK
jgi:hypothetical protein